MRVAHFTVITPRMCGLYETTRELVKGLRDIGIDSRLVDPSPKSNIFHQTGEDRGAVIADLEWAKTADILVTHSGLGEYEKATDQPIVHVCHGRPLYSFLGENSGGTPVYSYQYNKSKDLRVKSVVTFWPEHKPYHEVIFHPKPVHVVPAPVDVEYWGKPTEKYDFNGKSGVRNIVIADAWREDTMPFKALNAFILHNRENPGDKLHIYGCTKNLKGWGALIQKLKDEGGMGELLPRVDLRPIYQSADLVLTENPIETRAMREAWAAKCPVLVIDDIYKWEYIRDYDEIGKPGTIRESAEAFKRVLYGAFR